MPYSKPSLVTDIGCALDRFQACATDTIGRLTIPYVKRAAANEHAALGPPLPWSSRHVGSPLRALADLVRKRGGADAPLRTVAEDDELLDDLVANYTAGAFDMNKARSWLQDLKTFQEKVEADVAAARAAFPQWNRIRRAADEPEGVDGAGMPEILTPALAVKLMGGSITEAGLRARIRKGQAGPWMRESGKHQVRTAAFLAWYSAQPGQAQAAARARGQVLEKLATKHPPRRRALPAPEVPRASLGGNEPESRPST